MRRSCHPHSGLEPGHNLKQQQALTTLREFSPCSVQFFFSYCSICFAFSENQFEESASCFWKSAAFTPTGVSEGDPREALRATTGRKVLLCCDEWPLEQQTFKENFNCNPCNCIAVSGLTSCSSSQVSSWIWKFLVCFWCQSKEQIIFTLWKLYLIHKP